jgi:hypothetical protein
MISGGVSQEVRNIVHPESLSKQVLHSRIAICNVPSLLASARAHPIDQLYTRTLSTLTMEQRRASISKTTRLRSPTVIVTADVPVTEAEEWVAQWARVLARGALMSIYPNEFDICYARLGSQKWPTLTDPYIYRLDRYAHS